MTDMDFAAFYKHMSNHYHNQRNALEAQNAVLWDVAISLVQQISATPSDGSGINDLEKAGESAAQRLKEMLE